jgi:hypothetical protein
MRLITGALAAMLVALGAVLCAGGAAAANRPDYRDCSFSGGLDPDFVQLTGAMGGSGNTLTVSPSQGSVQVTASESADPGDNLGADTLTVMVSSPGSATQNVSGSGIGKVTVTAPLPGIAAGKRYTISWSATFDNGNHSCPSSSTPENTSPDPFIVMVPAAAPPPPKPKPKRHCHKRTKRVHGHKRTVIVCTKKRH